jgi:uncharacterized protein YndB with AHSA1/START domain
MSPSRTSETAGPLGTAERRGDRHVLRFERRLDHPIERVWAALTEPEQILGWLGEAKFDLTEGGQVELRWLNTDEHGNIPDEPTIMQATITRLEPPRLLEYEGDLHGLLRWELREERGGCVLNFTNETPAPDDYVTKVLAGWHVHLDFLADALEGRPITDWPNWPLDRWQAVHEHYSERQTD